MKNKPLVSVIVPVYNVEKYVGECLDSILNQTYKNIEVLMVNDGSTDNSAKLCKEYEKKDKRFKLYSKKNGGLSDARNYGLDRMKGDYVCFADSDDIIHPDFIKILLDSLKNKYSIASCRYATFSKKSDLKKHNNKSTEIIIEDSKKYLEKTYYQQNKALYSVSVGNKIFEADVFKKVRFKKGILYEDFAVIDQLILQKDNIVLIDSPLYFYRKNQSGITKSAYNKKTEDMIIICDNLLEKFKEDKTLTAALRVMKYTRMIEIITKKYENNIRTAKDSSEYKYIKKYRKNILFSKNTRFSLKASAILSFFGPNTLAKINLIRKGEN